MKTKLIIEFDSNKAAQHFAKWLCGQGEQDYWIWMECRECEEDGNITATTFKYHPGDESTGYGEFLADNTIRTVCGRLDK